METKHSNVLWRKINVCADLVASQPSSTTPGEVPWSSIISPTSNNHQTHNITLISCICCDFLDNDQFLSLRHIKTIWVLQWTRNMSFSVRFLISVLFIWETATVLQSPLTKLEGQFVLFLYSKWELKLNENFLLNFIWEMWTNQAFEV